MNALRFFNNLVETIRNPFNKDRPTKLKNGDKVTFRPISETDREEIYRIFEHLGHASLYMRFNTTVSAQFIQKVADQTINDVQKGGNGVIAYVTAWDGKEVPVGLARYVLIDEKSAELSITVKDEIQGIGLGVPLLKELVELAKEAGLDELIAYVNPQNRSMKALLYKLKLPIFSGEKDELAYYQVKLNPNFATDIQFKLF